MGRIAFVTFVVAMTTHIPLAHFSGWPVHWVVAGVAFFIFLVEINFVDRRLKVLWLYLGMVFISALISLAFQPIADVALGLASYTALQTIVFVGLLRDTTTKLQSTIPAIKFLGVAATATAFVQFYIEPTLWGLYADTSYEAFSNWGIPRSPSYFRSPQVFSAFVVFSVIFLDIYSNKKKFFPTKTMSIIILGGILSGSSGVLGGLFVYYMIKSVFRAPILFVNGLLMLAFGFILIFIYSAYLQNIDTSSPLARIVAVFGVGGIDSGHQERVDVWLRAFNDGSLIGNGIGSASTLVSGSDRYNAESYWLNMYYEGGVILVLALLSIIAAVFKRARRKGSIEMVAATVVFVLYAFIVHAFYAWSLPIVWLLLFGIIMVPTNRASHLQKKQSPAIAAIG